MRAGFSRRKFIKALVSAGTLGLTLPEILHLRAAQPPQAERQDTAVIQFWLGGGISQFESWDPKPDAPKEIRGPWNPIPTSVPGVRFCELLPKQAKLAHKIAILRSVWHKDNGHGGGTTMGATGKRSAGDPSVGAVAAKIRGSNGLGLPAYVQMLPRTTLNPTFVLNFNAQYLGASYEPFNIYSDPGVETFTVPNLSLARGMSLDRMENRKSLLAHFDRMKRDADVGGKMESLDYFQRSAFEIMTGDRTREAFDLTQEDPQLRERYGRHRWGQSALLARRLVEAGVTFVNINTGPDCILWDVHGAEAGTITKTQQWASFHMDAAVTTLIEDLYERGLNKKVLLVVWGEFGRTPIINKRVGRDHWAAVASLMMAGGGMRMGQVIGESDARGAVPAERPIMAQDVVATIYRHLGIPLGTHFNTLDGRPIPILYDGQPIKELVS